MSVSDDTKTRELKPRTIVLCFDGTSNEYSDAVRPLVASWHLLVHVYYLLQNTNVVKFFSLLKKDDFHEQLCYYQVFTFRPYYALCSHLTYPVAWRRNMVQPRSRLPHVPVGGQTARYGRCMASKPPLIAILSGMTPRDDRYMDAHVIEGYKFLMRNYRVGDKICIFGMSLHIHLQSLLRISILSHQGSPAAHI